MPGRGNKPEQRRVLALERIEILFGLAGADFSKHPERSQRHIRLAKKIAMRYNITIPRCLKKRFCKKCYRYIAPGVNCRIRANKRNHTLTVTCLGCGNVMRYPYMRRKT